MFDKIEIIFKSYFLFLQEIVFQMSGKMSYKNVFILQISEIFWDEKYEYAIVNFWKFRNVEFSTLRNKSCQYMLSTRRISNDTLSK